MMKRIISFIMALVLVVGMAPVFAVEVDAATITNPSSVSGSTYSTEYASKLDNIFNGSVPLFSNTSATFPLGSSLNNSTEYLVAGKLSGYQCYIYAQGVYYYLFGDLPYHGSGISGYWNNSSTVLTNQTAASYDLFKNAGVGFGAYLRTTGNSDGSYSGNSGHSIIILSYDSTSITFLEGNADGNGLVRITIRSWSEFNSTLLSGKGRRISHVVQYNLTPSCEHTYAGCGVCSECGYVFDWESTKDTTTAGIYTATSDFTPRTDKPYDDATKANFKVDKGDEVFVYHSVTNAYGNKWYYLETASGQKAYVYYSYLTYTRAMPSSISCTVSSPEEGAVVPKSAYPVIGTVQSNRYPLASVQGYLDGKLYATWTASNNTTLKLELRQTDINYDLDFAGLSTGAHTLEIRAKDIKNDSYVSVCTVNFYSGEATVTPPTQYTVTYNANGGTLPEPFTTSTYASINGERGTDQLIIYTNSGTTVETNIYGVELRVDANNKVIGRRPYLSETRITVPSGGFVLSGNGSAGSWLNTIEDGFYIAYDTNTTAVYAYDSREAYEANHKRVIAGSAIGLLPELTRDGYVFDGWYTAANGGTKVTEDYVINADTVLYAHWIEETHKYTVCFDANGGDGGPSDQTVDEGSILWIPAEIPSRYNYYFKGWREDPNFVYTPGEGIVITGDTVLYAEWAPAINLSEGSAFSYTIPAMIVEFPNQYYVYEFTPVSTGVYDIYSNSEYDTVLEVFDSWGNTVAFSDDDGEGNNFSLNYEFQGGQEYYLKTYFYGTRTGYFDFTVLRRTAHIVENPVDVWANPGETATFYVNAIGTGLSYQWQYLETIYDSYGAAIAEEWRDVASDGGNTTELRISCNVEYDGNQYRCKITDADGNVRYSDVATLTVFVEDGWVEDNGVWYYYQNGQKVTGWLVLDENTYYLHSDGAMATGMTEIDGKYYYFSSGGVMQTGWQTVNGVRRYFGSDGAAVTQWVQDDGKWYYLSNGAKCIGWGKIDGYWYYFDSDGAMQTGWIQVNSKWYYLNKSGVMQTGWVQDGGYWYYMDATGVMQTGWVKVGSNWFYMNKSGVMQTGWQKINGYWYYFASGGAMQTGWTQVNGKWYYLASGGAMQTGWLKLNGYWYYLDSDGVMLTGTHVIDGKTYTFNSNGVWIG